MMTQITVFTPTYNRAYILWKLYESLLKQNNKNFIWLIVDDGSTDDTEILVNEWITQRILNIQYFKQDNMGMVAAHNTAHMNIKTELNVCIDSDDYMPSNAINTILTTWNSLVNKESYMGLIGLDIYKNGNIVGDQFPMELNSCYFSEIKQRYMIQGDKKYVLRSDLIQSKLPYPHIKGEKFPAPSFLYLLLEKNYKFHLINKPLCIVEYLPDGNSMNKLKQYKESPNSFAIYRLLTMKSALSYRTRFKESIHYVSSSLLAKDYKFIFKTPFKLTTLISIPFGFLLSIYIKNTKRTRVNFDLNKK